MTNMTWKDSYEAGLPTYERADAIQMLYSADTLPDHKVQWSSDRVRALFATAPDCKSFSLTLMLSLATKPLINIRNACAY